MKRAKCISSYNAHGQKDPELTLNAFYNVKSFQTNSNINDQHFITIEANGIDIERPASSFIIMGR